MTALLTLLAQWTARHGLINTGSLLRMVAWLSTSLFLVTLTAGCATEQAPAVSSAITDYSRPEHWLAVPSTSDKPVDVFYVYPTVWDKVDPAEPNYCAIDNPSMTKGAAVAFSRQATAFETAGNVYAPYYRQADAKYVLSFPPQDRWTILDPMSINDVTAAFDYYIKHYNDGKPFLLVGHSQGTVMLQLLLSQYMPAHPEVYKQMIAAYVIGYPVTPAYMAKNKHLHFAEGPDDTGVIISYNSQSANVHAGGNMIMAGEVGIVINPVNWKRDTTLATASESLGSFMPGANSACLKVPAYADARIDLAQGVLVCTTADEKALSNIGRGVYHCWDYSLYYYNLRENAERRVKNFLRK